MASGEEGWHSTVYPFNRRELEAYSPRDYREHLLQHTALLLLADSERVEARTRLGGTMEQTADGWFVYHVNGDTHRARSWRTAVDLARGVRCEEGPAPVIPPYSERTTTDANPDPLRGD